MSLQQAWTEYFASITEPETVSKADVDEAWVKWESAVVAAGLTIINAAEYGCILSDGQVFTDPRRTPTQVAIGEGAKKDEATVRATVRRNLIGLKIFSSATGFEDWQREEPREIFEVTPTSVVMNNEICNRIYVTYNAGIIEN